MDPRDSQAGRDTGGTFPKQQAGSESTSSGDRGWDRQSQQESTPGTFGSQAALGGGPVHFDESKAQRSEGAGEKRDRPESFGQPGRSTSESRDLRAEGRQEAREVKHEAKDKMREAQAKAAGLADDARRYLSSAADQQKHRVAEQLQSFGSVVRGTAKRLDNEQDETLGSYAHAAADQLERAADYLDRAQPEQLLRDTQRFARRRPEIVIGGMFIAGVALARFLKAGMAHEGMVDSTSRGNRDQDFDFYRPGQQGTVGHASVSSRSHSVEAVGGELHVTPQITGTGASLDRPSTLVNKDKLEKL